MRVLITDRSLDALVTDISDQVYTAPGGLRLPSNGSHLFVCWPGRSGEIGFLTANGVQCIRGANASHRSNQRPLTDAEFLFEGPVEMPRSCWAFAGTLADVAVVAKLVRTAC